jgi:hypothetical protein
MTAENTIHNTPVIGATMLTTKEYLLTYHVLAQGTLMEIGMSKVRRCPEVSPPATMPSTKAS